MGTGLRDRIRQCNELARMAREDGMQTWGGWVWTREPDSSPKACVKVCPLEEYVRSIKTAERTGGDGSAGDADARHV